MTILEATMERSEPGTLATSELEALLEQVRGALDDHRRLCSAGLIEREGRFYPSVHYPPITMYPDLDADGLLEGWAPGGPLDLYVHIPFCNRRCAFCHYPVKAGKHLPERDRYLDALRDEVDLWLERFGLDALPTRSILFGGGTPTYLTPEQLDRNLRELLARLDLRGLTQFNYDVDPSTVLGAEGAERLEILRSHGVDRITLGLQSLDDSTLRRMNRAHDAAEGIRATEACMEMGFTTNIEFIFGYPGQTVAGWTAMMRDVIALQTDEIQLYRLKLDPYGDGVGRITRRASRSLADFPSAEDAIQMKAAARLLVSRAGYAENLSRVYSRQPDVYSHYAHNQCCDLLEQVGFGQTAFSSLRDRFLINTQSLSGYYEQVAQGRLPITRGLVRSREQQLRWSFLLPLKARSVDKARFMAQTGESVDRLFRRRIDRLTAHGLIEETEQEIRLSTLGRFYAEEVAHQFHHPDYIPYPSEAYADGPLHPYRGL